MSFILRRFRRPSASVLEQRLADRLKEIFEPAASVENVLRPTDLRNATIVEKPEDTKKMPVTGNDLANQSFLGRNIGTFQAAPGVFKEKERLLDPVDFSQHFSHLSSNVDKAEFQDVLNRVVAGLDDLKTQTQDDEQPYEFMKASIAKSRCERMSQYFPLLDTNFDGAVKRETVEGLVEVVVNGTTHDELNMLFDIFDVDQDGLLSEKELVHMMKDQTDATEKALVELVELLPESDKKQVKSFKSFLKKALLDEIQVPNKIRCVFHWSEKRLDDLITKEEFMISQKENYIEYSNLHLLVSEKFSSSLVAKGEKRTEFRSDMAMSIAFIIACGASDVYLFLV